MFILFFYYSYLIKLNSYLLFHQIDLFLNILIQILLKFNIFRILLILILLLEYQLPNIVFILIGKFIINLIILH